MPNPSNRRRVISTQLAFDPVAQNYFTRAGITELREKNAVNDFVKACRSNSNIWTALQGGFVYLVSPTSYGASLHNLLSSSFSPVAGVAPAFGTNGWTFNGTNQYLRTGFVPSSVLTINSGFMLVYSKTNSSGTYFACGALNTAGTAQWGCALRISTNNAVFNAYDTSSQVGSTSDSSGTFVFSLSSSTTKFILRNGSSLASGGTASGSLPAFEMYVGARNNNGTAANFAPYNIATVIQGVAGLSTTDAAVLTTFVQNYNTNVISGGR